MGISRTRISDCFGAKEAGKYCKDTGSLDWRLYSKYGLVPGGVGISYLGAWRRNFVPVVMVWCGRREVGLRIHNTN